MTVLLVLGGLTAVLAIACWWESRSGRPAWGAHLDHGAADLARSTADPSRAGKRAIGSTLAVGALFGVDGGADGG